MDENDDTVVLPLPQGGYTREAEPEGQTGQDNATVEEEEREYVRARPRPVSSHKILIVPLCSFSSTACPEQTARTKM